MTHKTTKIDKGSYQYRGVEIDRYQETSSGAWRTSFFHLGNVEGETLKDVKNKIDKKLKVSE